jgi:hypothetical protein
MNQFSPPIPALEHPKLILQAFHLCKSRSNVDDAEKIWDAVAAVAEPLGIPSLKKLPDSTQPERERIGKLVQSRATLATSEHQQDRILPLLIDPADPTDRSKHILSIDLPAAGLTGGVYPLSIHDSYAIDLTLIYNQSKLTAAELGRKFNPQGCLLPSKIQASIGQTLMLFGRPVHWPDDEAAVVGVAKDFAIALLQEAAVADRAELSLSGRGKFLGGSIFEFESEHPDPILRHHILVWLEDHLQTSELETKGDYYNALLQLWLSRSKIQWCDYQADLAYKGASQLYEEVEKTTQDFDSINAKQSNAERLNILEGKLLELPRKTLEYAKRIRDVQHQLTTIEINTDNFRYYLSRLQDVGLKSVDDLAFLERFLSQDCQIYRKQAIFNLDYLATGRSLFDQTIATIRGLVEIDRGRVEIERQQQQKAKDEAEKIRSENLAIAEKTRSENLTIAEQARSRKLTILVGMVGAGLSVTSISSSGVGQKVVQYVLDNFGIESTEKTVSGAIGLYLSNLLFHALVGGIFAIVAGGLFWWFTRHSKGKP